MPSVDPGSSSSPSSASAHAECCWAKFYTGVDDDYEALVPIVDTFDSDSALPASRTFCTCEPRCSLPSELLAVLSLPLGASAPTPDDDFNLLRTASELFALPTPVRTAALSCPGSCRALCRHACSLLARARPRRAGDGALVGAAVVEKAALLLSLVADLDSADAASALANAPVPSSALPAVTAAMLAAKDLHGDFAVGHVLRVVRTVASHGSASVRAAVAQTPLLRFSSRMLALYSDGDLRLPDGDASAGRRSACVAAATVISACSTGGNALAVGVADGLTAALRDDCFTVAGTEAVLGALVDIYALTEPTLLRLPPEPALTALKAAISAAQAFPASARTQESLWWLLNNIICDISAPGSPELRVAILRSSLLFRDLCAAATHAAAMAEPRTLSRVASAFVHLLVNARIPGYMASAALFENGTATALVRALPVLNTSPRAQAELLTVLSSCCAHPAAASRAPPEFPAALANWLDSQPLLAEGVLVIVGALFNALSSAGLAIRDEHAQAMQRVADSLAAALDRAVAAAAAQAPAPAPPPVTAPAA